jgi:hypothetical protein
MRPLHLLFHCIQDESCDEYDDQVRERAHGRIQDFVGREYAADAFSSTDDFVHPEFDIK